MDQGSNAPERPLEDYLPRIESLLNQIIQFSGFELSFKIRKSEGAESDLEAPEIVVDLSGPDADLLLEKNAAVLNALEYVVLKAVRLEERLFGKITFDCRDWRRLRAEELKLTARIAAERVAESGTPFSFSPLSPRERRIIHLALKDQPRVQTVSEGAGPERKVIIRPAPTPAGSL